MDLEQFVDVMSKAEAVALISEVISLTATSSFNRRKVFEQREVVARLIQFVAEHSTLKVLRD